MFNRFVQGGILSAVVSALVLSGAQASLAAGLQAAHARSKSSGLPMFVMVSSDS